MADFPDVRRARLGDRERLGTLWIDFLQAQAALDDRLAVADDALERWHNDYAVWLSDETQRLFVAEPAGTIQGFVTARRWGPPPIYAPSSEVYVNELYVVPEARRQGLGTQLVRAVRHWADTLGADRLRLQALADNAASRAFWAAQEARPFTSVLTVELEGGEADPPASRRRIGF